MKDPQKLAAKYVAKLMEEGRTTGGGEIQTIMRILEAVMTDVPWDRLLLALSNIAFRNHEKAERKSRAAWKTRAKDLHDAMESEKAKRELASQLKKLGD